MGNYEKLLQKAYDSPNNFSFKDECKLAELAGFTLVRSKGSHKVYRHPSLRRRMNFQNVKGQAKPYQLKQLLNAIEEIDNEGGET
jgi:predicted RNA binding protein YcfA (HicA-like mRNA interferase family)